MYNFSWYWSSLSAASPDLLKSCSSCGECLVEFKCPLHSKCWKCFFLVMPIFLERLNYLLWNIEHIMIKFRVRFYLQKGNGVFCTYILLMDHFKSQQCLTGFFHTCLSVLNFYFYHSFVQPTKIGSRSLQTLLTLESSKVQSAEPMEIDILKGDTLFWPEKASS